MQQLARPLILQAITGAVGAVGSGGTAGSGLLGGSIPRPCKRWPSQLVVRLTSSGEEGPELFLPGESGSISNNDQFEAARDALSSGEVSSSSSGGDDALGSVSNSFSQNSSVLATSSSLIRENAIRSEERTMMGGSGTVVIETQVINNVEYASVEQVQKASAAATKQARAQVFSDLRNKPSSRAQIGMR